MTRLVTRLRAVVGAALAAAVMLISPTAAGAALSVSVPGTVNLGAAPTGSGSFSAQLGTVTVTASGVVAPSFTVTVSSTDFITGGGSVPEKLPKSSVSYWSGPVTAASGLQTAVPGQLTTLQKRPLSSPVTAFASTGLVLSITTSWNPTLVFELTPSQVAGTYRGTITHSVA